VLCKSKPVPKAIPKAEAEVKVKDLLGLPPVVVDPRTGSGEFAPLLRRRGLPVAKQTLDCGDFAFTGLGRDKDTVMIGIERKKLGDLLQCIEDGRFAGRQLPKLKNTYAVTWVVIEGAYRADPKTGLLQTPVGHGKWRDYSFGAIKMASAVANWKIDMQVKAGLIVERTWNEEETADLVATIYKWWNLKGGWEGHRAHLAVNKSLVDGDVFQTLKRRGQFAAVLPGLGSVGCRKAQGHFKSIQAMVEAPISEWRKILGVVDAVKVHRSIREEE
jgi:ERCC4-type nuclease